jgi:hypothetical protein
MAGALLFEKEVSPENGASRLPNSFRGIFAFLKA